MAQFFLLLMLGFAFVLMPNGAWANQKLEEAQRREDAAYNDYYRELRKLGPHATEAQKQELRDRTLGAARVDVVRAKQEIMGNAEKDLRSYFIQEVKSLGLSKLPLWLTDPIAYWKKGGASSETADEIEPEEGKVDEASLDGDLVGKEPADKDFEEPLQLDASGVKRELVFPGKNKVTGLPGPSPTPSILQLDGKDASVEMLSFPGAKKPKTDTKKSK